MNIFKKAPPACPKNLKGQTFGNGKLLALDAPPQLSESGHWEWLCQCQIHDVKPKYFRISKLERGAIKSCGCHGGSRYQKNNQDLIGQKLGFITVLNETRIKDNRPEFNVRCIICGREKWVRAEQLRKHVGISCICAPSLKGRTIGKYYVLSSKGRKNDAGLPEMLCEIKNEDQVWVSTEKLLRTLAKEKLAEKKLKADCDE